MLKLTNAEGDKETIYINPAWVLAIRNRSGGGSVLDIRGAHSFHVQESPEAVVAQFREVTKNG